MKIAEECLRLAHLFEAELLVELMLRFWRHPFANDEAFRNEILESAIEAIRSAVDGHQTIAGVKPENLNLVAAIWYAEFVALDTTEQVASLPGRKAWLDEVRRSVPSCFCDPELLD